MFNSGQDAGRMHAVHGTAKSHTPTTEALRAGIRAMSKNNRRLMVPAKDVKDY